jgi:hypothetical protein
MRPAKYELAMTACPAAKSGVVKWKVEQLVARQHKLSCCGSWFRGLAGAPLMSPPIHSTLGKSPWASATAEIPNKAVWTTIA